MKKGLADQISRKGSSSWLYEMDRERKKECKNLTFRSNSKV